MLVHATLIGGPHDGKTVVLDDNLEVYQMNAYPEQLTSHGLDAAEGSFTIVNYHRHKFVDPGSWGPPYYQWEYRADSAT